MEWGGMGWDRMDGTERWKSNVEQEHIVVPCYACDLPGGSSTACRIVYIFVCVCKDSH